jgi:hypothetical protein
MIQHRGLYKGQKNTSLKSVFLKKHFRDFLMFCLHCGKLGNKIHFVIKEKHELLKE